MGFLQRELQAEMRGRGAGGSNPSIESPTGKRDWNSTKKRGRKPSVVQSLWTKAKPMGTCKEIGSKKRRAVFRVSWK